MRCFISIDFPADVKKEFESIQKKLPEAKMTLVDPKIAHLTLKFFGELSETEVNKVKESLNKIKFKKFNARLSGIGVFPDASFVRVAWVGLEPKEKFLELHKYIEGILSDGGFKKDKGFESHTTLARVKFLKGKEEFIRKLGEVKVNLLEFTVDKVSFKKSTLTRSGPVYEELASITLN